MFIFRSFVLHTKEFIQNIKGTVHFSTLDPNRENAKFILRLFNST